MVKVKNSTVNCTASLTNSSSPEYQAVEQDIEDEVGFEELI